VSSTPDEIRDLRRWICDHSGLRGEDYRATFLERRVLPRLSATGCATPTDYLGYLESHPEEGRMLLSKLLVPTTEWFRNPEIYKAVGRLLLERSSIPGWSSLKLLSAPCSTGEEAMSLAILLDELGLKGRVVAGDLSRRALSRLAAGLFPLRGLDKLDTERKARYFSVEGDKAKVSQAIAGRVNPVCCDLGDGMPGKGFHLVMLRNLFIYMTEEAQVRMLTRAGECLVSGGLLVLGRVETIGRSHRGPWRTLDRDARIYEWAGSGG
jgi:chemotaxis methyl-accepting protein methylase